jgi:diaminohydroxyphosphoribosylaminopyrimidine deaminase/5-amino-6-(5-phosphoribosylamino)uracil reductase
VLADDPQLTARDASGGPAERQPLRVVVDTEGRTPADARVRDHAAPTLILTAAEVKRDGARGLDLEAVLALLYDQGVRSVLLEGGPTLAGSFVRAGLVDKVVGYLAPTLLGAGLPALSDAGICTVGEAARLRVHEVTRLGADVKLVCYPVREPADVHRDR